MKKNTKLKIIGLLTFLASTLALAAESKAIHCQSLSFQHIMIDISDLKSPPLIKMATIDVPAVVFRDNNLLTLTGASLDTSEMISIDFQVADIDAKSSGPQALQGVLRVAEGPGSEFKSTDLRCRVSALDRFNLLSLKSNSKW